MSRRMSETASLKSFDSIPTMANVEATLGCVDMNQRYELFSGRLVSFAEVGHPCGHPVFCFLGLGCMRYYSIILEDLAFKHHLRIYCIDRPGTGMSQTSEPERWTPLRMAEIVEEMANGFNIQKFSLMGHSCGAIYAMACALRLKTRVVGTVWLMSPWVHLTVAKRMKWIRHVPASLIKSSHSTATILYRSLSIAAREPPSKGYTDPNLLSYDRQKLVKAMLQDNMAESLEGANNDLMVCLELYHSFGFSYKDVTLPVHVFWGTKDPVISREAVDWMEQRLAQCTLSVIDGGTHGLLWRQDVVSKIFKGIASSWKLAEFERSLSQRWSIKQLGINKHQLARKEKHDSAHPLDSLISLDSPTSSLSSLQSPRAFQSYRDSTYSEVVDVQQAIQTSNIYGTNYRPTHSHTNSGSSHTNPEYDSSIGNGFGSSSISQSSSSQCNSDGSDTIKNHGLSSHHHQPAQQCTSDRHQLSRSPTSPTSTTAAAAIHHLQQHQPRVHPMQQPDQPPKQTLYQSRILFEDPDRF